MKSKNFKYSAAIIAFAGVALTVSVSIFQNKSSYSAREEFIDTKVKGITGASEYLFNLRKNILTGEMDLNAMVAADKAVAEFAASRSGASLGLQWEELGPDNVGGRTRGLIIDPLNPNKMFAGGVAGGLWVSYDGGGMWTNVNDHQGNLAVSWITRAANGDIYYSTGEGLAQPSGANSNSGTIGRGIFKSTDGGLTFNSLPKTVPTDTNSLTVDFAIINRIEAHPTNPDIIYAGTSRGLRVSTDGGATWKDDYIKLNNGSPSTGVVRDIDISKDGTIIVNLNNQAWISYDGTPSSFVNKSIASGSGLPSSSSVTRIEFDIAPNNSNVMYAAAAKTSGKLHNIYYSGNRGETWSIIGPGGSASFEPYGDNGQGWYDNIIRVNPHDDGDILLGGVQLWRWKRVQSTPTVAGQWYRTAAEFPDSPSNPYYVHSDKHNVVWHPTDPNTFFVATDGGVSRSKDGGMTHRPMNKNYNVFQCYSVAFAGNGRVMAGSQDNGTQYIDFKGNSSRAAIEIMGGDGNHCEFSMIDPNVKFTSIYYGDIARTKGNNSSGGDFTAGALDAVIASKGASFVTPVELWESFDDANSIDSVTFRASNIAHNFTNAGDGKLVNFKDTLRVSQASAQIVPGSIEVASLSQILKDDGLGNMKSGTSIVGSVDYTTRAIEVTFPTPPPVNVTITVSFGVKYSSGADIVVPSSTGGYPIKYTLTSNLNSGDSIRIHDKVQSKFALGLNGSVWVTKRGIDFGASPNWVRVANIAGTAQHMSFSRDGNLLFVGTQSGTVYRISGLSTLSSNEVSDATSAPPSSIVTTSIGSGSFGGRSLTDVTVDPNNNDHLVVTLGNYGSSAYIYRSTNATAATPTWISKQGSLPKMPVYSAIIEKMDPKKVIIGTEYGMYSCSDITASSPVWVDENNNSGGKFPKCPVFMVRQQLHDNNYFHDVYNDGLIYVGSHGRGIWRSSTLAGPVGIKEEASSNSKKSDLSSLKISPNPISVVGQLNLDLTRSVNQASLRIFDSNGKIVKELSLTNLVSGKQNIALNVSELSIGTYFVNITSSELNLSGKMVVVK